MEWIVPQPMNLPTCSTSPHLQIPSLWRTKIKLSKNKVLLVEVYWAIQWPLLPVSNPMQLVFSWRRTNSCELSRLHFHPHRTRAVSRATHYHSEKNQRGQLDRRSRFRAFERAPWSLPRPQKSLLGNITSKQAPRLEQIIRRPTWKTRHSRLARHHQRNGFRSLARASHQRPRTTGPQHYPRLRARRATRGLRDHRIHPESKSTTLNPTSQITTKNNFPQEPSSPPSPPKLPSVPARTTSPQPASSYPSNPS